MKIRMFSLILLGIMITTSAYSQQFDCPNGVRTMFNELSYTIDTETNEIIFNLACDPCLFESGESENCECHRECDLDHDQCYDDCIDSVCPKTHN